MEEEQSKVVWSIVEKELGKMEAGVNESRPSNGQVMVENKPLI